MLITNIKVNSEKSPNILNKVNYIINYFKIFEKKFTNFEVFNISLYKNE